MSGEFSFIHTADVHLDSPLRGIERYPGAPAEEVRGAARRAFSRLVDLAIDESVAFVLVAGDLYDGDWPDYNTGLFFVSEVARLTEQGIRVFVISGNHDAASKLTRVLRLPKGAHLFATASPETIELDELGVAVHGQGFAQREVTDNLAAGYPLALPGRLNIGLLHTSLDGREGHEPYAPCTLTDLRSRGYDYWALGHVHRREVVSESPWVVFPGNLQGRHARETGPKGAELVRVVDGEISSVEHRTLDVVRWAVCEVDATGASRLDDVLDRATAAMDVLRDANDSELVVARVRVTGICEADAALRAGSERFINECRAHAASRTGEGLWLEKTVIATSTPPRTQDMAAREDALGGLMEAFDVLAKDEHQMAAVAAELTDLMGRLPAELRLDDEPFDPSDPDFMRELLRDAASLLQSRIGGDA